MGSAKTAMLLTQAYNFEERGMQYLCMKPIIDDREKDNVIRSRIGIERKCSWIYPESDLYEMLKEMFEKTLVVKPVRCNSPVYWRVSFISAVKSSMLSSLSCRIAAMMVMAASF